jgi:hypothetical protein
LILTDCGQFSVVRRNFKREFVEFDWFSIVFGKLFAASETKKSEFSRRNLLVKASLALF